MNQIKIHSIFSTPLIHFKFSKHDEYRFPDIKKSVRKPDGWKLDLNTSFPNINSDDSFVNNITSKKLKKDLCEDIEHNLKKINYHKKINIIELWYNVYHSDQGQEPHDHLGSLEQNISFISGIYFNKNSETCEILFKRDPGLYKIYGSKEFQNTALDSFFWDGYIPNVSDGDVILFPSYLTHEVRSLKNEQNKMRLTFAFNLVKS